MVYCSLGFIFWLAILTHGININSGLECSEVCPDPKTVPVPDCDGTRIEPAYHQTCKCFLGYNCCPHTCPQVNKTCQTGLEISIPLEDCCGCNVTRCDACPKRPDPKCNPVCELLTTLPDISDGCLYKTCNAIPCPELHPMTCPNCQVLDVSTNSSFCQCPQQRCVEKPCKIVLLPPKECVLRKWVMTECGCKKHVYDASHYCDKHNALASTKTCKNKCFKNEVLKGKGPCGCDNHQCIQINESCLQTFEDRKCPAGTVKQIGTTPCGVERDLCIKCDTIKLNSEVCDSACNTIIKSKDVNGCPIEKCEKNACVDRLPHESEILERVLFYRDKCGCPGYTSLKRKTF